MTDWKRNAVVVAALLAFAACARSSAEDRMRRRDAGGAADAADAAARLATQGRDTFRHDTFGDEDFWGGKLRLHEALEGAALGGVGPGVSPRTALAVGLKVDVDALSGDVKAALKRGAVNLDDPATTVALLGMDAVVGVKGFPDGKGGLKAVGITCALCHSTVDDSFAPGIGRRLDGWANRDLDVGTIISLAPDLSPFADLLGVSQDTVRAVTKSWGPGKFDAELILDGKAVRPDGKPGATLIPPAFGLAGVNLHTSTGWGSITHWNALVANLEMGGKGTFQDARLDDAAKFPVAARAGLGHRVSAEDRITPTLPALHEFQLALEAPRPPDGSFDAAAADRGRALFAGKAACARCHVPPVFTEPGWNMHAAQEVGVDDFQAQRSPDGRYRTSPLRGLWSHQKGGFYHDGRFANLAEVVNHYDATFKLGLSDDEKNALVEYLKSL